MNPLALSGRHDDRCCPRGHALRSPLRVIVVAAVLALGVVAPAQAASDVLARVKATKVLNVCIWPEYFGISLRDPKTGELRGLDIDLAREFGKDLGVRVNFVDSSFAKLIPDLTSGRCDVAMFAVGVTPARQEKLAFSQPYLRSDIVAITAKSNRRLREWADIDLPGVNVAVVKGTLHEPIMKARLAQATLMVLDTADAREEAVESGRADVFMTDFPYSQRMLETVGWARRILPPATYHLTPYAYAVRPGDEAWLQQVDRFVERIKKDGRLLAAARRHELEPIVVGN